MSVRPFSPTESFAFPKPPDSNDANSTESGLVGDKDEDSPFSDEAASGESGYYSTRSIAPGEKMTIYRQFVPTLSDELAVEVGELVTVVQAYDDGWAKVRKDGQETVGLIPLDCFRAKGEDVPAFLASKRISSIYLGVAV
ncbi:uncharacterized protein STEHIDRAFT_68168 [Stereum hirsutum FP-91666 SS1]|uniref:SH3 domain-containing protein n=1 Tax=Stereum hirsutum (strain FP-91666) TaxID=721885 RepID=R7RZX0_STEHR|nr:uncharacterized protein STEHIDRAFT_68168 [Stereum hirsutum FP-91666 SS1]EIM80450.1 hypothetical protein STEHIDRAFT_68168 [Stereum hirsutum FP-91666 SS1]